LATDVSYFTIQVLVQRGQEITTEEGPIIVCTRNDVLDDVLKRTPENRRKGSALFVCGFVPLGFSIHEVWFEVL
jgi:hypothetical protein